MNDEPIDLGCHNANDNGNQAIIHTAARLIRNFEALRF